MKKTKIFMAFMAVAIMAISCSNDDLQDMTETSYEQTVHYANMVFNSEVPSFEEKSTRATNDWENGAKVYLQFSSGVYGIATYDATNNEWGIFYYGELDATIDGKCEAYYFENADNIDFVSVTIGNATIVYSDKAAFYSLEDNTLNVTANLKPMTGRVRLKGQANKEYLLEGNWQVYTEYDFTRNVFTKEYQNTTVKINKDGYSNYMYLLYPEDEYGDEENIEITLDDKESNTSFTKTLKTNMLVAGKSGYLDVPTLENVKGWAAFKFKDYTVSDVTFRMIRVVAGTEDIPNSYYIGETEVTQALYGAVMKSAVSDPQHPISGLSDRGAQFITQLNEKTGGKFRLPTKAEWEFAAKGGHLTKGYTYSGSDIVSDVAWYRSNSNYQIHQVKTKQPNEIGIYDMSGNVAEWTSASNVTVWGGSYSDDASYCRPVSRTSGSITDCGIRLVCN